MIAKLYLSGVKSHTGTHVVCPLPSSCIVFFLRYCQTEQFEIVFTTAQESAKDDAACSEISFLSLKDISVKFVSWNDVPAAVANVCLPSIHQPEKSLVRAGLCVVLRHIIKTAHAKTPEKSLIDLLGFRQGSMRMCSEVSGWTKLCEVDLPESIAFLIQSLKKLDKNTSKANSSLSLPLDLLKLEGHFKKKCRVHNDDKRKRAELSRLKEKLLRFRNLTKAEKRDISSAKAVVNCDYHESPTVPTMNLSGQNSSTGQPDVCIGSLFFSESNFEVEHIVILPHGVRRVRVQKSLGKRQDKTAVDVCEIAAAFSALNTGAKNQEKQYINSLQDEHAESSIRWDQFLSDFELGQIMALPGAAEIVDQLNYQDIEYVHTYSEGAEMTLADLILFVYIYFFLEYMEFDCQPVAEYLSGIHQWVKHIVSLPTVVLAGQSMGWNTAGLAAGLSKQHNHKQRTLSREKTSILFTLPEEPEHEDENEMELSRCAQMKHKAIKPEVLQALKKLEEAEIKPCIGKHPRGENVTVSWEEFPAGIHPREGDVPEKRTRRKCQQLENLVTAVQAVARPEDAVVDFCSGGGHLGIVLAYLLPHCQVYMVENKEESLLKACSRLESLALTNVTLYQCNIDYFIGKFDVGVCLHACGSATDMVQQLCLNAGASFVICPCCYGSIHRTHLLTYPRSKQFQNSSITYKDFLTLGHAADQTEFNIALEGQGRECMNLVDSDRAAYAREFGYHVTLCSLQPLSCTPKNNLLVGFPA